jgi:hypothetical protein
VFGINLTAAISELASIPQLNQTLTYFSSPAGIAALRAAVGNLSAAVVSSLQQAPGDLSLTDGVSRSALSHRSAGHTAGCSAMTSCVGGVTRLTLFEAMKCGGCCPMS